MALVLDTNLFIAAERSKQAGKLVELLDQIPDQDGKQEALVSVVTASELLTGVHRAIEPTIKERRRAFVDAILDQFNVLPIDLRVAREHSRLTAELLTRGELIGIHDSWIAASALTYGHALVTGNDREFKRVKGLTVHAISL